MRPLNLDASPVPLVSYRHTSELRVPITPLRSAIARDAKHYNQNQTIRTRHPGLTSLARATRIPERQLYRWLEESRSVTLAHVDQYCCATNRLVTDLYPEAYE